MKKIAYNTGQEQWHYEFENFGIKYQLSIIQRIATLMYPFQYAKGIKEACLD